MLVQQLLVLGYVPVVEVGNSQVEQNIEKKGEIKNREVEPVIHITNNILDRSVYPEDPERFHQQVQEEQ